MLYETAIDMGIPGPDNDYGMGLIDVYQAYLFFRYPENPRPPKNFTAYSDHSSPNAVQLNWTDPVALVNGDTLLNFEMFIYRDSVLITTVNSGSGTYTDTGSTDGNLYHYALKTCDLETDSLSLAVVQTLYCGGSPVPSPPDSLSCQYNGLNIGLNWSDPVTQADGTPLDDLACIYIYRDDILIDSVVAGVEQYHDNGPFNPPVTLAYMLKAVDNEQPTNMSEFTDPTYSFVGDHPDILIWLGPDVTFLSAESADSIFISIRANSKNAFISSNLFEFGYDMSVYDAIFVVLGIYPYNQVLQFNEGNKLQNYLLDGGKLFLEGGDCFGYDPSHGGYDIRPWFSLGPCADGDSDVFNVTGSDFLSGFSYNYFGTNQFMDELQPVGSTPIWINPENDDTLGVVYYDYGQNNAVSIGVVPSFGGITNYNHPNLKNELMCMFLSELGVNCTVGSPESGMVNTINGLRIYPNPFTGNTTIEYFLEQAAAVYLKIFDVNGLEVKSIVESRQVSGVHQIKINDKDLPAGVYFCILKTNKGIQTRKMIKL